MNVEDLLDMHVSKSKKIKELEREKRYRCKECGLKCSPKKFFLFIHFKNEINFIKYSGLIFNLFLNLTCSFVQLGSSTIVPYKKHVVHRSSYCRRVDGPVKTDVQCSEFSG